MSHTPCSSGLYSRFYAKVWHRLDDPMLELVNIVFRCPCIRTFLSHSDVVEAFNLRLVRTSHIISTL